jgi:hypothetical protein
MPYQEKPLQNLISERMLAQDEETYWIQGFFAVLSPHSFGAGPRFLRCAQSPLLRSGSPVSASTSGVGCAAYYRILLIV